MSIKIIISKKGDCENKDKIKNKFLKLGFDDAQNYHFSFENVLYTGFIKNNKRFIKLTSANYENNCNFRYSRNNNLEEDIR